MVIDPNKELCASQRSARASAVICYTNLSLQGPIYPNAMKLTSAFFSFTINNTWFIAAKYFMYLHFSSFFTEECKKVSNNILRPNRNLKGPAKE